MTKTTVSRAVRRAFALAAALALGGCELAEVTQEASEERVVVEAVLRTDAAQQVILLHRTLDGRVVEGVQGARVTVTDTLGAEVVFGETAQECFRFSPRYFEDEPGEILATCYRSPQARRFVFPGKEYRLRIELPDGGVIRGVTTVPGDFRLTTLPFASFESTDAECWLPPATTYEVRWTRAAGAWAYVAPMRVLGLRPILAERGIIDAPDPLDLQGLAVSAEDTTLVLPDEFGVFERFEYDQDVLRALQGGFPNGVDVVLMVAAADRNYVNGVRGGRFNPSGPVRISSVVGDGVGVFGSLVPLYVRIDVHPPDGTGSCAGTPA